MRSNAHLRALRLVVGPFLTLILVIHVAAQTPDRRLTREAASGERRVALVVGNNTYAGAALSNAVPDARAMAGALRELGFTVTLLEDASRASLIGAIADIGESLRPTDVALFFFAGHGVQIGGENYLIPIDFTARSSTAARLGAVAAADVQDALAKARVSLLVLDACRNNPFTGQRAGGGGLAPMEARGSLVAFATGAGQTASDNAGARNGLFTQELLKVLKEPNLNARDVFYRVRQRVFDASKGQQFPAVYDGLLGDLVFRAASAPLATAATPPAPVAAAPEDLALRAELALWDAVKDSQSPKGLEDYLRQYPAGRFRVVAEERLAALRAAATPAPRPPAPAPARPFSGTRRSAVIDVVGYSSLMDGVQARLEDFRAAGIDPQIRAMSVLLPPTGLSGAWAGIGHHPSRQANGACTARLEVRVRMSSSSTPRDAMVEWKETTCDQAEARAAASAVATIVKMFAETRP